ncbi:MAG: thioredoxin [Syntrophomonadaceae bacterium]|nr:thioredoxin [Syntrophomonadaceae bacterium]
MKNRLPAIIILLSGSLLAGIGLWRGEAGEILLKGIRICLECIGIG